MLGLVLMLWLISLVCGEQMPSMPLHFEAVLEVTCNQSHERPSSNISKAHLLDSDVEYPPRLRRMKIRYDFDKKVARADILAGYDKGKTYIRRYDTKKEYMVKYGEYKACERAYLGEAMPFPQLPNDLKYKGTQTIRGINCNVWVSEDASSNLRINVLERRSDHVPIQLMRESLIDGVWTPLVSYDFTHIKVQPQEVSVYTIPGGYTHKTCTRNVVGFPYIHIFDYYMRF